ncbi:questin oxidase family protein [Candidatus Mycobacterium methanotrophicum]|uniref:Questin oxidase family protein n=1 Tax=Candidatus Mycobacterium methanotrophicum TaxID=2943498 RepID=A0ABY4QNR7_9MYCO|nr:questin oxidase family protein [Candidatus Mycobacterium methanotrophicum]UQX11448.1 questin oxidase family protein [Candidatus Mycobacterium methanotrophicum]
MGSVDYVDAMNAALDRLRGTGFYIGGFFANHGPMAAEALARLGYCDEVDGWVDTNIGHREHAPLPTPSEPIGDWRAALGDRNRGGDWVQLFRQELAEAPWRDVLRTWWPRLLPGCAGSLTHGLIRTAHAVRSLRETDRPSELQIDELARALGFWATVFAPLATNHRPAGDLEAADVNTALGQLTAEYAGHYTATKPSFPVPLIHTITAPAAMRLLLPELPANLHAPSLCTMTRVNRELFARFGGQRASDGTEACETDRTFAELAAEAVEIGDEHAIKMCEAAMRENAARPDARYLSAASTAVDLIRSR